MERDISRLIKIPGELTSAALDHIVTAARDVYDYNQSEYLNIINGRLLTLINDMSEDMKVDFIPLDFIDIICN